MLLHLFQLLFRKRQLKFEKRHLKIQRYAGKIISNRRLIYIFFLENHINCTYYGIDKAVSCVLSLYLQEIYQLFVFCIKVFCKYTCIKNCTSLSKFLLATFVYYLTKVCGDGEGPNIIVIFYVRRNNIKVEKRYCSRYLSSSNKYVGFLDTVIS